MNIVPEHYEVHLRDYLYILRKRQLAIFVFLILAITLTLGVTYFEKVIFRASSTILIERNNPNITDFKEVMAMDASVTEYYQTQHQMFKSRSLAKSLIQKENLTQDPFFQQLLRGGVQSFLRSQTWMPSWFAQGIAERSPEEILIRKMLRVEPVRNSRLVEVSVSHLDPKRSMELTNRLVQLYIERNLQDRFAMSSQATGLIASQLIELKDKVAVADKNLQKYKEEKGLLNIPSIREGSRFLEEAKFELVKIQAEESKLSKRYLPAHPKRIHIHSQIAGLEEKIKAEEDRLLLLGQDAIGYQELEREAESARQIYESLLKRMEETTSEAKSQASNIIVVDKAEPPTRPYRPKPVLNLLIGLFFGFMGGIFLAFFLEYLDSSIKVPEDIEKGLGLDLLGIIPADDGKEVQKRKIFFDASQHSPAAESVRALRTALLFKLRKISGCRTLLITSPNPYEGKSTIALNLAVAFQQNHLKVVLLEADLRKPKLHKLLNISPEKGIADVLEKSLSFEQAVYRNAGGLGLDFLACGPQSPHPAEILGSKTMKELLENLKQVYDIIVIDSPPYLAVADVAILSEYVDSVVVIAKYHGTDRRHLKNLKKRFSDPHIQELGVVINGVSVKEKDYYYQQYYYYGYGDREVVK
ncbi:MAG: polysaccharide biosynthesis tyrosine autokinase [Candidatus Omnitrophica bacterium]|nr:polysaccharide biosynthesis tyrosine autokinase [Candidatus Omnitrophota bacterium]